jgi:hypothetical protein
MEMFTETGKLLHLSRVICESRFLHVSDPYTLRKERGIVLQ